MTTGVSYESTGTITRGIGHPVRKTLAALLVIVSITVTLLDVGALIAPTSSSTKTNLDSLNLNSAGMLSAGLKAIGVKNAYADDDDDKKAVDEFDKFKNSKVGEGTGKEQNDFDSNNQYMDDDTDSANDNVAAQVDQGTSHNVTGQSESFLDNISMIIQRLMPGYYIKSDITITPDHPTAWEKEDSENYCSDLDSGHRGRVGKDIGKGAVRDTPTLLNPNCDIPGIGTQAVQDVFAIMDGHGVIGAEAQAAKAPYSMGYAKDLLPTDTVPVNPKNRAYKYTGLELFGYNLHWAKYNGEWDQIDVQTSARLKSSMTLGASLKTVGQAIGEGIGAAAGSIAHDIGDKFKSGHWIKGLLSAVNPMTYIKGASIGLSSGLYRIIGNVMNSYEVNATVDGNWYRPNFIAETMYSVHSLTDSEKTAIVIAAAKNATKNFVKDQDQSTWNYNEAEVRNTYAPPAAPTTEECDNCTGSQHETGQVQDWQEWKDANKTKLDQGKNDLGIDLSKYDGISGDSNKKYKALKTDWDAAVDAKVSADRESKVNDVYNFLQSKLQEVILNEIKKDMASKPASAWMYCVDANGNPEGSPSDKNTKTAIADGLLANPGKEAFNASGKWQCSTPMRPTIVGGLFGSSRPDKAGDTNYIDTRRTAYSFNILEAIIGDRLDKKGQKLLGWSQDVALVMNTVVGWCFQPLLEQLGIKDLLIDWTKKLRDTIYMQFLVIAMAAAGLVVILKLVRGQPIQSFRQLAMIFLTFALGVMLLFNTEGMFALVDDVPTALERAAIGTVFNSSGEDKLCTATGTPKGTVSASAVFKDLQGKDTGFNPDSQIRTLQCRLWETFVVSPWSYGQWGTNFNDLWATGYASKEGMNNSGSLNVDDDTEKLVGDATVDMGDGVKIHNWAIYQIMLQTNGTITTEDNDSHPTDKINTNMYRIIDAQAGPYNGLGRDGSHLSYWTGHFGWKLVVGLSALALSIMGLIAIGGLALKKLEYTLTATVMLLVSPIMLLFGLIPGKNQMRLKQYGFEILGLCIKRVIVVIMLSIGIEIMLEMANASQADWITVFAGCFGVCAMLHVYGKEMLEKITARVDKQAGSWGSANDFISNAIQSNPTLLGISDAAKNMILATGGAAIGSALAGNLRNPNRQSALQGRMIDAYNPGGAAFEANRKAEAQRDKRIAAIKKKYEGKTDARSIARMNAEMEAVKKAYLRQSTNYRKNKALADRLQAARSLKTIKRDANGNPVYDKKGHLVYENRTAGNTAKALANMFASYNDYYRAKDKGEINANRFRSGEITAQQVARQRLSALMNRTRAIRINQGRSSVLLETRRMVKTEMERNDTLARQELLRKINATSLDTPTINAAGKISASPAAAIYGNGRTVAAYGMTESLGMTDEQLKTIIQYAPNTQQILNDWQIAEQTGDWAQVRADLNESQAMQKGTDAYKATWEDNAVVSQDLVNAKKNQLITDAKLRVINAKKALAAAKKDTSDSLIAKHAEAKAESELKKAQTELARLNAMNSNGTELDDYVKEGLRKELAARNFDSAQQSIKAEQLKDQVASTKSQALDELLGKDYRKKKAWELSANGKEVFEEKIRDASLKWQSSQEMAAQLDADGHHDAAEKLRHDADVQLKKTREDLQQSRKMEDNWRETFKDKLTDLDTKLKNGDISEDKYKKKVQRLFELKASIESADDTIFSIEASEARENEKKVHDTLEDARDHGLSQDLPINTKSLRKDKSGKPVKEDLEAAIDTLDAKVNTRRDSLAALEHGRTDTIDFDKAAKHKDKRTGKYDSDRMYVKFNKGEELSTVGDAIRGALAEDANDKNQPKTALDEYKARNKGYTRRLRRPGQAEAMLADELAQRKAQALGESWSTLTDTQKQAVFEKMDAESMIHDRNKADKDYSTTDLMSIKSNDVNNDAMIAEINNDTFKANRRSILGHRAASSGKTRESVSKSIDENSSLIKSADVSGSKQTGLDNASIDILNSTSTAVRRATGDKQTYVGKDGTYGLYDLEKPVDSATEHKYSDGRPSSYTSAKPFPNWGKPSSSSSSTSGSGRGSGTAGSGWGSGNAGSSSTSGASSSKTSGSTGAKPGSTSMPAPNNNASSTNSSKSKTNSSQSSSWWQSASPSQPTQKTSENGSGSWGSSGADSGKTQSQSSGTGSKKAAGSSSSSASDNSSWFGGASSNSGSENATKASETARRTAEKPSQSWFAGNESKPTGPDSSWTEWGQSTKPDTSKAWGSTDSGADKPTDTGSFWPTPSEPSKNDDNTSSWSPFSSPADSKKETPTVQNDQKTDSDVDDRPAIDRMSDAERTQMQDLFWGDGSSKTEDKPVKSTTEPNANNSWPDFNNQSKPVADSNAGNNQFGSNDNRQNHDSSTVNNDSESMWPGFEPVTTNTEDKPGESATVSGKPVGQEKPERKPITRPAAKPTSRNDDKPEPWGAWIDQNGNKTNLKVNPNDSTDVKAAWDKTGENKEYAKMLADKGNYVQINGKNLRAAIADLAGKYGAPGGVAGDIAIQFNEGNAEGAIKRYNDFMSYKGRPDLMLDHDNYTSLIASDYSGMDNPDELEKMLGEWNQAKKVREELRNPKKTKTTDSSPNDTYPSTSGSKPTSQETPTSKANNSNRRKRINRPGKKSNGGGAR